MSFAASLKQIDSNRSPGICKLRNVG